MHVGKRTLSLFTSSLLLGLCIASTSASEGVPDAAATQTFVIGPEAEVASSHAKFPNVPNDVIKVSAQLRVTKAIDSGLNFFAIQVNFPNKTWAHGGPQLVDGKYQMNWGGLVNRGGGSGDYTKENPAADLLLMQNGPDSERSAAYHWVPGKDYLLTIERGKQVTLPPGPYVFIGKEPVIAVSQSRSMWTWTFTIRPLDGHGPVQVSTLYDTADRIASFYLWNECGYGSCDKGQSATWSLPVYRSLAHPDADVAVMQMKRF